MKNFQPCFPQASVLSEKIGLVFTRGGNSEFITTIAGCLTISVIFLPLCLFSLVYWLMLLTVRQTQRGVPWLGLWSSVERHSVWKDTHMSILCRWQWVCLTRVNCSKNRNIENAFALCYFVLVQTVIHELFHVLGFSKDLFSQWKDCSLSSQGR